MTGRPYKVGDVILVKDTEFRCYGPYEVTSISVDSTDGVGLEGATRQRGESAVGHRLYFYEDEITGWLTKREYEEQFLGKKTEETPPVTVVKTEAQKRKGQPIFTGCIAYFPDALLKISEVSLAGNQQHHPGKPLHWEFDKSKDHPDCLVRHMIDFDEPDTDEVLHAGKVAWRALANLQTLLEKADPELHKKRQAQRDRAARGER